MKERVIFQDFNELWANHVLASTSERMKNDQAEQNFWKGFMEKKIGYQPDPFSRPVAEFLKKIIKENQVNSVLELGPGWGNYTLDLAQSCDTVECVDISEDVLQFIQKIGKEHHYNNIQTRHIKWEDFSENKKYDMVFGYNCFYRLADLKACFEKMTKYSKKICVVGMNSGVAPAWVQEINQAGIKVSWEWKDYIYFVNVLYQMGFDPQVKVLPFCKQFVYSDEESLLQGECRRIGAELQEEKKEKVLKILLKYFKKQEGGYCATAYFHSGIVSWNPNQIKE